MSFAGRFRATIRRPNTTATTTAATTVVVPVARLASIGQRSSRTERVRLVLVAGTMVAIFGYWVRSIRKRIERALSRTFCVSTHVDPIHADQIDGGPPGGGSYYRSTFGREDNDDLDQKAVEGQPKGPESSVPHPFRRGQEFHKAKVASWLTPTAVRPYMVTKEQDQGRQGCPLPKRPNRWYSVPTTKAWCDPCCCGTLVANDWHSRVLLRTYVSKQEIMAVVATVKTETTA